MITQKVLSHLEVIGNIKYSTFTIELTTPRRYNMGYVCGAAMSHCESNCALSFLHLPVAAF